MSRFKTIVCYMPLFGPPQAYPDIYEELSEKASGRIKTKIIKNKNRNECYRVETFRIYDSEDSSSENTSSMHNENLAEYSESATVQSTSNPIQISFPITINQSDVPKIEAMNEMSENDRKKERRSRRRYRICRNQQPEASNTDRYYSLESRHPPLSDTDLNNSGERLTVEIPESSRGHSSRNMLLSTPFQTDTSEEKDSSFNILLKKARKDSKCIKKNKKINKRRGGKQREMTTSDDCYSKTSCEDLNDIDKNSGKFVCPNECSSSASGYHSRGLLEFQQQNHPSRLVPNSENKPACVSSENPNKEQGVTSDSDVYFESLPNNSDEKFDDIHDIIKSVNTLNNEECFDFQEFEVGQSGCGVSDVDKNLCLDVLSDINIGPSKDLRCADLKCAETVVNDLALVTTLKSIKKLGDVASGSSFKNNDLSLEPQREKKMLMNTASGCSIDPNLVTNVSKLEKRFNQLSVADEYLIRVDTAYDKGIFTEENTSVLEKASEINYHGDSIQELPKCAKQTFTVPKDHHTSSQSCSGIDNFECDFCKKYFTYESFNEHIKDVHLNRCQSMPIYTQVSQKRIKIGEISIIEQMNSLYFKCEKCGMKLEICVPFFATIFSHTAACGSVTQKASSSEDRV